MVELSSALYAIGGVVGGGSLFATTDVAIIPAMLEVQTGIAFTALILSIVVLWTGVFVESLDG